MKTVVNSFFFWLLLFCSIAFAKECKKEESLYSYYYINGVGNDPLSNGAKILSVSVNDFNYDIYSKNPRNVPVETEKVADLKITYNKDKEIYESKLTQVNKRINFVPTDPESKDYLKCNSINKLFENSCRNYFLTLLSQTK